MNAKDTRPKARLPRGLADRAAADIRASEAMIARIRRVYERYGFQAVETPLIEFTDALGKFLPDLDRPNEGVFSFKDDEGAESGGDWLSLRYDLTAPLARYVAENYDKLPKPYRSYRFGWVFRNEKPGPGRFRQFMQFDADTVGAASPAADAEMCMMAADALEEVGIPRGQYVIKVNSRKVLDGVMDAAGVPPEKRLSTLRAIDKLDRLGLDGVRMLLGKGRKDESGDFTPGTGVADAQTATIVGAIASFGDANSLRDAGPGDEELLQIDQLVRSAGYNDRVRIDRSVVRGLEYYTGAVFEAELLLQIPNDKGQPVVFGSVGGGGRYDGLVGRFLGKDVPATGFSVGVSRLQAALTALGKLDATPPAGPVVVLVLDKSRIGEYQAMVAALRRAEIPAEMYLGDAGFGAQMKYADRRNAPLVIISGGDEKARGTVQIKDLVAGKQIAAGIADRSDYVKERPGQIEVPEADMVETVNRLTGRGERRPP